MKFVLVRLENLFPPKDRPNKIDFHQKIDQTVNKNKAEHL